MYRQPTPANQAKRAAVMGWSSLVSSLIFCSFFVAGVVANALGNTNGGLGLHLLALFAGIVWAPVAVSALALAWRSWIPRIGCLLPFFVYGVTALVLIYVFKQL